MGARTSALMLVAALAALPAVSLAQEPPPEAGPMPRTQENLITFKLLRMTQVLELSEEQTVKIYPAVTRLEKEKLEISKRINARMRSLRTLLQADRPDEPMMLAAVDEINALRLEVRDKDGEIDRYLKSQLTVKQYAKFTLFLVEFYRGLGEKLERARGVMRDQFQNRRNTKKPELDAPF